MAQNTYTTYGTTISIGKNPCISTQNKFEHWSDEQLLEWYKVSYKDDAEHDITKMSISGEGTNRVIEVPKIRKDI